MSTREKLKQQLVTQLRLAAGIEGRSASDDIVGLEEGSQADKLDHALKLVRRMSAGGHKLLSELFQQQAEELEKLDLGRSRNGICEGSRFSLEGGGFNNEERFFLIRHGAGWSIGGTTAVSPESPVGMAVMGKGRGSTVVVKLPEGKSVSTKILK